MDGYFEMDGGRDGWVGRWIGWIDIPCFYSVSLIFIDDAYYIFFMLYVLDLC